MVSNELLLLIIIEKNGSAEMLLNRGLTYSQISMMIQKLESRGYVSNEGLEIHLTEEGKQYMQREIAKTDLENSKLILPQEHYYREPISEKEIVLPKKI